MDTTSPAESSPVPPPPAGGPAPSAPVCPICRTDIEADTLACPNCRAPHHKECWDYNCGCGTYGCPSAPPTQRLADIEIPASFWGQTEKECPVCRNKIQAAALRCRFCGTVFSTARPQQSDEFQQERAIGEDLPRLRRASIWLLVFSVIPFTAAPALLLGGIWFSLNQRRLAALPPAQRAVAKIALGVAAIQTAVLIAGLLLAALLKH